jgi:phenylpropionate dioxygenase-like ring-hydroxylating dioxygenase large terminal subunit
MIEDPNSQDPWLRDLWYFALPGHKLRKGRTLAKTLLGEPMLFGRTDEGKVFAMYDICPHRGIPLSYGEFDGREVMCCYHGWKFDPSGKCTEIPSLVEGQKFHVEKIGVKVYPCHEVQGNIWIYFGDGEARVEDIPVVPDVDEDQYRIAQTMMFPTTVDHAVIGLMDPCHGPYVHRAWWWRSLRSVHEKAKRFAPVPLGFQMVRHRPSANSRGYKIMGGVPETEITVRLPGVRVEHVRTGKHVFCGLTAITPIVEDKMQVSHIIYWNIPWLTAFKPLFVPFARAFLNQDRQAVAKQGHGLVHNPKLMLINDADTQARWYYQIKKEYVSSKRENRPFEHPVKETVLRWRS